MKKNLSSLLFFCLLIPFAGSAQPAPVPTVPEQVKFANISVQLDPDARRIVQQDVNALLANRQYWTAKLDRVALYFPLIEAILIQNDVPTDFKYLAVQESSLVPDAVSSSSAVGYWQFKRETAIDHGMRVDDEIDERKSITASTHGAAKYLKKSNEQFNNWVASLYSYYLGAGGIAKLIPPEWTYAREIALDGRTDRYILRFFAHKIAIENALQTHQASNTFALIEYPNGGGKTLRTIADELGIDEGELRKYNRWVLGETVPTDRTYVMAIPVANNQINDIRQKIVNISTRKTPGFIQNDVGFPVLRRVTAGSANRNEPVLYEINGLPGIQAQSGDNAAALARKAKISLSSFLRYNDMSDHDPILVNDIYYLAKKRKKALVPFHTVRESETSRSISQRYGIRLRKLLRFNRLDRVQKLATGRVMWLQERRPNSKPVEIINAPTPPVYDQTPTPPTRQDVVVTTPGGYVRPAVGSENIPRNASERKLYQPKLIGGGVTPNDGTSEPASKQRTEPMQPSSSSAPVNRPLNSPSLPSSDGSQRVVIVRTPGAPEPTKAVPVATAPERENTTADITPTKTTSTPGTATRATPTESVQDADLQPTVSKSGKTSDTFARNQPTKTAPTDRSETGKYEGPQEQQADGSITALSKTPTRPATTAAPKAETRIVPPAAYDPNPTVNTRPAVVPATTTTASAPNRSATTHTVEPGQTYYSISKLYGLTVDQLLAMNNLTTADKLAAGQKLSLKTTANKPVQASSSGITNKPTADNKAVDKSTQASSGTSLASATTYHTVAKGETMFRITQIYGVTVDQIQTWNNLTDTGVKVGQKLKIMK